MNDVLCNYIYLAAPYYQQYIITKHLSIDILQWKMHQLLPKTTLHIDGLVSDYAITATNAVDISQMHPKPAP